MDFVWDDQARDDCFQIGIDEALAEKIVSTNARPLRRIAYGLIPDGELAGRRLAVEWEKVIDANNVEAILIWSIEFDD